MAAAVNIFHTADRKYHRLVSEPLHATLIGGFVATAYAAALHPLDTLKTRRQVAFKPGFVQTRSYLSVIRYEGMAGLWRGWQVTILAAAAHRTLLMALYEKAKMLRATKTAAGIGTQNQSFQRWHSQQAHTRPWYNTMDAGVITGALITPAECFAQNVRVQMQAEHMQKGRPPIGNVTGVMRWLRDEGASAQGGPRVVGALMRGAHLMAIANALGYGVLFATYERLLYLSTSSERPTPDPKAIAVCGVSAGFAKEVVFYPFNSVLVHMQSNCMPWHSSVGDSQGARASAAELVEFGGIRALYAGLVPHAIRTALLWGTSFTVFDALRHALSGDAYLQWGGYRK